jgi:hypothetical protein
MTKIQIWILLFLDFLEGQTKYNFIPMRDPLSSTPKHSSKDQPYFIQNKIEISQIKKQFHIIETFMIQTHINSHAYAYM